MLRSWECGTGELANPANEGKVVPDEDRSTLHHVVAVRFHSYTQREEYAMGFELFCATLIALLIGLVICFGGYRLFLFLLPLGLLGGGFTIWWRRRSR